MDLDPRFIDDNGSPASSARWRVPHLSADFFVIGSLRITKIAIHNPMISAPGSVVYLYKTTESEGQLRSVS